MPLPQWAIWSEVAIRLGWTAAAALIWAVMSRRGHDGGLWAVIGLVHGPFAVPAAVISARRAACRPPVVVADGPGGSAGCAPTVLVVVDAIDPGSWAAQAVAADAIAGTVELAVVFGRDTLDRSARAGSLRRARCALAAVAAAMAGPARGQVILERRPDAAVALHSRLRGIATVMVTSTRSGDRLRGALGERLEVRTAPTLERSAPVPTP